MLRPQQVAGAAYLQIPHGDLEAGAELHILPYGRQALACHLRENFSRPEGEVGVSPAGAAADAPADLMELGKPHAVSVFYNKGVHVGDVDAGLDDGGADEDLYFSFGHVLHHAAELALAHLAVGDADGHVLPQKLPEASGGGLDVFHAVVQIVHLPAPVDLPPHGLRQNAPVVLQHIGLHRLAVAGRLLDGGHIPYARERHVQRAGDGRRGEGEGVHLPCLFPQPLLGGHAEALLLVDDEQPQIVECHIFLQ